MPYTGAFMSSVSEAGCLPSPTPMIRLQVRLAVSILSIAFSRVFVYCSMSLSTYIQGFPRTFSGGVSSVPCPNESSAIIYRNQLQFSYRCRDSEFDLPGNDTPISLIAMRCCDTAVRAPTAQGQPIFTKALLPSDGWYTVSCG